MTSGDLLAWPRRLAREVATRAKARPDTEFQQALIRFIIGFAFFLYFASHWFSHPEEISFAIYRVALVFLPLSAAILIATLLSPAISVPRRIFGAVLDFSTASTLLYIGGETSAPLVTRSKALLLPSKPTPLTTSRLARS